MNKKTLQLFFYKKPENQYTEDEDMYYHYIYLANTTDIPFTRVDLVASDVFVFDEHVEPTKPTTADLGFLMPHQSILVEKDSVFALEGVTTYTLTLYSEDRDPITFTTRFGRPGYNEKTMPGTNVRGILIGEITL